MNTIKGIILLITVVIILSVCGIGYLLFTASSSTSHTVIASSKVIDGKTVEPYGFMNTNDKVANVKYRVVPASVIVSIIGVETIVAPIYFLGWEAYEPVCADSTVAGQKTLF